MGTFLPASTATNSPGRAQGRRLPLALAAAAALVLTGAGLGGVALLRQHSSSTAALVSPAAVSAPVTTVTSNAAVTANGSLSVHAASIGSAEPWTITLVSTQAEADALQQGINEAEAIRAQTGAGPLPSSIALVGSESDASRVRESVAGQNPLLASLGLGEIRLVDLRTP